MLAFGLIPFLAFAQNKTDDPSSRKIYGFADSFFVSTDLLNYSRDTLIQFDDVVLYTPTVSATIDPFNGYYYFLGKLPRRGENLFRIDLHNLSIQNMSVGFGSAYQLEFDFIRNRLLVIGNGGSTLYAYSVDADTRKTIRDTILSGQASVKGGQICTYRASDNTFLTSMSQGEIGNSEDRQLLIDGYSGELLCNVKPNGYNKYGYAPYAPVDDLYGNDIYCSYDNAYFTYSICSNKPEQSVTIPNYYSHLDWQQNVFNRANNHYLINYIEDYKPIVAKIAIIDVEQDSLLAIVNQPWQGKLNLQEIYDKPAPPLYMYNDTLFVPKGVSYEWYLDSVYLGKSSDNFWIPRQTGHYHAKVAFRSYTSTTNRVGVWNTSVSDQTKKPVLSLYPNPANEYVRVQSEKVIESISIYDALGRVVLNKKCQNQQTTTELSINGLEPGLYFIGALLENGQATTLKALSKR